VFCVRNRLINSDFGEQSIDMSVHVHLGTHNFCSEAKQSHTVCVVYMYIGTTHNIYTTHTVYWVAQLLTIREARVVCMSLQLNLTAELSLLNLGRLMSK